MLKDQYDCVLTTTSQAARDGYVAALDLMLEGQAGVIAGFEAVTRDDPGFALGWVGLARAHHYAGDMAACGLAMQQAQAVSARVSERETSHIAVFDLLFSGQPHKAYEAIKIHVGEYPRDAMVAQTCSSVFGLIGFSGRPGREAEMLSFNASFLPHYGNDWWALSQYAFALCETGKLNEADKLIDKAMALNPRNAHGAHVRSHVSYELGETDLGRRYLASWMKGYDKGGVLFTHLNWHEALWALEQGDVQAMWQKVDAAVSPEAHSGGPAINVLTDTVSILHRASLAGVDVDAQRWQGVSDFARSAFPKTGNAFVDMHAVLAHAMAGEREAYEKIMSHPAGPAADLTPDLACGFDAVAHGDWEGASASLSKAMSDTARIGGSRAQRDLLEQTLLVALVKQGKQDEARAAATQRRPILTSMVN
ncbi:MAG: tetratricopeptide repeat protein [Roseobacter sp.]